MITKEECETIERWAQDLDYVWSETKISIMEAGGFKVFLKDNGFMYNIKHYVSDYKKCNTFVFDSEMNRIVGIE